MDIIELLKNLIPNINAGGLLPIINLLRENSFDLKRTVQNLTPEKLAPIVESLSESRAKSAMRTNAPVNGLSPIASVADKEIIYTLNRYLSTTN